MGPSSQPAIIGRDERFEIVFPQAGLKPRNQLAPHLKSEWFGEDFVSSCHTRILFHHRAYRAAPDAYFLLYPEEKEPSWHLSVCQEGREGWGSNLLWAITSNPHTRNTDRSYCLVMGNREGEQVHPPVVGYGRN